MDESLPDRLLALVPQMEEDARIHRTWTTEAARRDLEQAYAGRTLGYWVGDVAWHERWARYYEDCAQTLREAAEALRAKQTSPFLPAGEEG